MVIAIFLREVLAAPSTGCVVGAALAIGAALAVAAASAVFFLRDFFPGDADVSAPGEALAAGEASAAASFFFRDFFSGEADASAAGEALAAGEASAAGSFFLRDFFAGEADASAPAAALASGEAAAVASVFLCDLRLAGEPAGEGDGDWAFTTQAAAKPSATSKPKYLVFMNASLMTRFQIEKTENEGRGVQSRGATMTTAADKARSIANRRISAPIQYVYLRVPQVHV